jgi:hypothetical protein
MKEKVYTVQSCTVGRKPFAWLAVFVSCTDKKGNKSFLIFKEIQLGSGAKSYMRKGFLIYEVMRKFFPIYEEAVSYI